MANLTLNPAVTSIAFLPASASCNAILPCTTPVVLQAYDATGATIIGATPFVSTTGNALTINLSGVSSLAPRTSASAMAATSMSNAAAIDLSKAVYDGTSTGLKTLTATTGSLSATFVLGLSATPPAAVRGLTAWYDLGDSSTLTATLEPNILQWKDKSGNNLTLSPASATTAFPVFNASGIDGRTDVAFNGSTATFLHATMSAAPGTNPPHTIFVVGSGQTNTAGAFVGYSGAIPSGGTNNSAVGSAPYDATSDAWWFGGNYADASYGGGANDGAAHLFTKIYNGATITGDYDGAAVFSQSQSYDLTDAHIDVGAQNEQASVRFTGEIGEIVIYNSALATADYQYIEGYLACKWGLQSKLPANHPYKGICPSGNPLNSGFTGPTAWYDASDASTIVGVSAVNMINDKSGHGNTLTQTSTSAKPYLTTVNSQQALMFSGGQQLLSSTTNTFATGSNPSTVFAVAAFTGWLGGGYAQFFSYGAASNYGMRGLGKSSGNGYVQSQEYFADLSATSSWSTSASLVFASYGSATEAVAQNGETASTASYSPSTSAGTALYFGSELGGNNWTGPVYEVLIYNTTLSTAERQFVEGYLACKQGLQGSLAAGHPYASSCPSTGPANLSLVHAVSPTGTQPSGTNVTYTTTFTNASGTLVYDPTMISAVPADAWYKVGTVTQSLGNTGLAAGVTYSSDGGATFTYTPASGAGGAPSGYDANVTTIRRTLLGALGSAPTVNSGSVTYVAGVK